jgi:hypothetical protein
MSPSDKVGWEMRLNSPASFRLGFVVLTLLASASLLFAQVEPPDYPRFNFTPLIGYRTTMSFSVDPQSSGANPRVVFEANPSYGFAFGAHINEEDIIEFRWARQDSHTHLENVAGLSSRQHVTLDQFHGDFTHEYILEEWRTWARPFVIGSVGATRLSADAGSGFTRFSFGIGGGVKFFASRHFGFRVQAEWLPIVVNPNVAFVCGGGCIVHIRSDLTNQGEFVAGPIIRF